MGGEKRLLIALAYLSFVSLGLPDALPGVSWPSIRAYFDLPLDALGTLLIMYTCGYLVSSFYAGRVLNIMTVGTLLSLSCFATFASLAGYAVAPAWWILLGLAVAGGLGAGAIDTGLNMYAATNFSARTVNWLHAFYGVGATVGPIIMTRVLVSGRPWQLGYTIVGVWQLVLAVCFWLTRKLWSKGESGEPPKKAERSAPIKNTLRLRAARLSMAVFFVYTGLEASAGAWAYTLFTQARRVDMATAGLWISIYWGSLTAGRVLSGLIVGFLPAGLLLRSSIALVILGTFIIWINPGDMASLLGLSLMGLSLAPVFPSLIAGTPERLGAEHSANGVGFQIAAAVLGQSLLPAAIGLFADGFGLEAISLSLFCAALLLFALYAALSASQEQSYNQRTEESMLKIED